MKHILISIILFISVFLKAQQFSIPSQPYRNMVYLNPAYTGFYEASVASLMNRNGLTGFPGNPQFQDFELHAPLKAQSIALGLQAMHQQLGAHSANEIFFNYAHRISLNKSKFVFGLKMGITSTSMGSVNIKNTQEDPAFPVNNYIVPNFGFGLAYYGRNFYTGVSVPYLLGASMGTDGNLEITPPDFRIFNYIFSVGGKISIGNSLKLEPHGVVVYSTVPTILSYEGIINFNISDRLIIGGGYSSNEAVIGNLGYYLSRQISFLYSYQYGIGETISNLNASHEVGLLFYFGYKIKTSSPRDF